MSDRLSADVDGRILVAEDDVGLGNMIAIGLTKAGYRVGSADNGESAWNALCSENYDLLITDHSMPRLTGLDLLRRIRVKSPRLPAILMSADMPRDVAELMDLVAPGGALHKPFTFRDLLAKVRTILSPEVPTARGDSEFENEAAATSDPAAMKRVRMPSDASDRLNKLAHQLLTYELASVFGPRRSDPVIFLVCDKLRRPLFTLAGSTGLNSILARATVLARPEVEWLKAVTISSTGTFQGLREAESRQTPLEISRGERVLVAHVLGLLFTFIGEPLTRMLLEETWSDLSF
jgi:DNA-binding response OmpR family regulator